VNPQPTSRWGRGSTRASRKQRAVVLRRYPTCHIAGPHCTTLSTEDDHVTPLSQGGTDHMDNRRGACTTCHREKSQQEAATGATRWHAGARHPVEQHPGLN